jgi:DNA-directed RNA polymerase II subunit RPB2
MSTLKGEEAKKMASHLLQTYFQTHPYPFTSHHLNSYDQFLSEALPSIIRARNPILILKDLVTSTPKPIYKYKVEIFVGGIDGTGFSIGTPTVSLQDSKEVRVLFPNEARLRNLTYSSSVLADVTIRVTILRPGASGGLESLVETIELKKTAEQDERIPLFKIPIMLHSRYCILHDKPAEFLRQAGECEYDYGGYFIVDGSEKVLITTQEQAFNTLYVSEQTADPKLSHYGTISCLSPQTRQVKRVVFLLNRMENTLHVQIPYVRTPLPVFMLFRAMKVQSDKDILQLIFPDLNSAEAKLLAPMLHESILEAEEFKDTHMAVQFIRFMTKGFSEAHVLDILHNQLFIHIEDLPGARVAFLADCVRQMLRVKAGIDRPTNRDDTRNQRCLSSGFLTQMLFQDIYGGWIKAMSLALDKKYNWNKGIYSNERFVDLFLPGNRAELFQIQMITDSLLRAFKGKWGSGFGEERQGVIQQLSRLSYHDFLSHCRRAVLNFDTTMKLPQPRRLNSSQYGYFCTSETPTGASIGITKNLSILTLISNANSPAPIRDWLFTKGRVIRCLDVNDDIRRVAVPLYINGGIVGYTVDAVKLTQVLRSMKWTGCLPAFTSVGFAIRDRKVFLYLDEGRPVRPLIHLGVEGALPLEKLHGAKRWRDLILGTLPATAGRELTTLGFVDPLQEKPTATLDEYITALTPYIGAIEYVDPYEQNETSIANFPESITKTSSHLEIHPSTILGLMTNMIPFPHHNQSPRNQLSCSQSKQGLSVYSTNYPNRFDNQVHVLCYGEAPLSRTLYYDYVANGQIGYGQNLVLAIGSFTGYNQDDGIVMNADAVARGMFRNMTFRSYQAFEEEDEKEGSETRIANPARVPGWTELKPGVDYSKLDERGIIQKGEYVDEDTVIVGRYLRLRGGVYRDASVTPQVWTRGRVEEVVVTVNNFGLRLVKIRVVQDRIPELGDKFSNRHGQKGTIGMLVRGCDMPRTADGVVPDMIMNPHAIPSRMTIGQLLETLFGKAASYYGGIANGTSFMNDGDPTESIGEILEKYFGVERYGNEILYDGTSGVQIPSTIFIGQCYTMRLKHMTEDKWNARAEGRREQRTHQPTGGRGNEGGLRIGEMERDAIVGHGMTMFTRESIMKRGDGETFLICNGCGTIPIYNEAEDLYVCSLCDGPVQYSGKTVSTLELIPPTKRSLATFSKVEMPYVVKLLEQEMSTYMNLGMRFLTGKNVARLPKPDASILADPLLAEFKDMPLPDLEQEDLRVPPEVRKDPLEEEAKDTELANMPGLSKAQGEEGEDQGVVLAKSEDEELEAAMEAAARSAATAVAASRSAEANRLAATTQEGIEAAVRSAVPNARVVLPPSYGPGAGLAAAPGAVPSSYGPGAVPSSYGPGVVPSSYGPGAVPSSYGPGVVPSSYGPGVVPSSYGPAAASGAAPLAPLAEGPYSEAPQIQIVQQVPLLPIGTTVVSSAGPGGRPTLVVDTSSAAMAQQGLPGFQLPGAVQSANTRSQGSAMARNVTRRATRGANGPGIFNRPAEASGPPSSNARVTVQKLG